jgi:hypothetical protein
MTAGAPDAVEELVCSARGCRADATWGVLWNNPKLHTPDRRKVWLACDEHREHLEEYLRVRAFWQDTVPVADLPRVEQGQRPGLQGLPGFPGSPGFPEAR